MSRVRKFGAAGVVEHTEPHIDYTSYNVYFATLTYPLKMIADTYSAGDYFCT